MRTRVSLLLFAILMLGGAIAGDAASDEGGTVVCETYFGCRKHDFNGTFACQCNAVSTSCTECCVVETAVCTVSQF
jgi:hypothetical protein